ncbi:MAG: cation transporter [Candidatus Marinimicrobia bacterium]|nr:cation transporter [Candidatus Neomarinimicrobiota bacterium]
MNKTIITTMGVAFLASLCCIGPIALLVLGSTSVGLFTVFEPFRPILAVLSLGVLVYAYFKLFRKDRKDCCKTEDSKKSLRKQKQILMGITPFVFVLLTFPYFAGSSHDGNSNNHTGIKSEWLVEGMTCGGCAAGMEGSLAATDGMNYCKVNYKDKNMLCFTDDSKLTIDKIPKLVSSNGFKAIQKIEPTIHGKG